MVLAWQEALGGASQGDIGAADAISMRVFLGSRTRTFLSPFHILGNSFCILTYSDQFKRPHRLALNVAAASHLVAVKRLHDRLESS